MRINEYKDLMTTFSFWVFQAMDTPTLAAVGLWGLLGYNLSYFPVPRYIVSQWVGWTNESSGNILWPAMWVCSCASRKVWTEDPKEKIHGYPEVCAPTSLWWCPLWFLFLMAAWTSLGFLLGSCMLFFCVRGTHCSTTVLTSFWHILSLWDWSSAQTSPSMCILSKSWILL